MVDVLANRLGDIAAGDSGTVREVRIASSFYNTIEGGHHSYIRVPEQIQTDVETYANALLKGKGHEGSVNPCRTPYPRERRAPTRNAAISSPCGGTQSQRKERGSQF